MIRIAMILASFIGAFTPQVPPPRLPVPPAPAEPPYAVRPPLVTTTTTTTLPGRPRSTWSPPAPAWGSRDLQRMRRVVTPYPGGSHYLEAVIADTWPEGLRRQALDVAWCESRGKPTARNGQYRGLFQIGRSEWKTIGEGGDVHDGWDNSAGAFRLFVQRGWRPWECQPAR